MAAPTRLSRIDGFCLGRAANGRPYEAFAY